VRVFTLSYRLRVNTDMALSGCKAHEEQVSVVFWALQITFGVHFSSATCLFVFPRQLFLEPHLGLGSGRDRIYPTKLIGYIQ
jgi:hypothetical protein